MTLIWILSATILVSLISLIGIFTLGVKTKIFDKLLVLFVGFAAGGLFICLGFLPKMAAFFSIMPPPVMGAILIFVTSFMVLAGFQIVLTSAVNTRKIFIIGMSFIFGLSVDMVPGLYASIPSWLQPVFGSSLTLATVMAIILNQILSIGNRSEAG